MSVGVFLEVLSLCYNRTGAFIVTWIYLIKYDRGFVILLVNLLVRLTCMKNREQNNEIHVSLTNKLTNRITNPRSYLIR